MCSSSGKLVKVRLPYIDQLTPNYRVFTHTYVFILNVEHRED